MLRISLLVLTFFFTHFVHATPTRKFISGNIPSLLRSKLSDYLQTRNKDIHEVVATKSGEWIIIGSGLRYFSNATLFNNIGIRQKINSYIQAGRDIDAVAIDDQNRWVVTSGNFRYFSNTAHFDSTGLRTAINREIAKGRTVSEVAIAANDSWAIISNGIAYYSNGLPASLKKAIIDSRVQGLEPRIIQFQPGSNLWIFVAGQKVYTSQTLAAGPAKWANEYRDMQMQVDKIFLAPNRGWSVISNQKVSVGSELADQWEWNFNGKSIFSRIEHHQAAGVSVAFLKNGRVSRLRTYGMADHETKRPVYTDTIFPIASMSKAVGAFSFAHAQDHNVLSMERPVPYYTNLYPNSDTATWQNTPGISLKRKDRLDIATIKRFLSHSGGTNKHGIGTMRPPVMNAGDEILGRRNGGFVQFIHDTGQVYDYSGGGFAVAETILESASSEGAVAYLNDVLAELKMRNSTFGSMEQNLNNLARRHDKNRKVYRYEECPVKTAGGLFSTPTEYSYFVRTLLNAGKNISNQQIVDPKLVQLLMQPMHELGSTLSFCTSSSNCAGVERCVANRCMTPIRTGANGSYVGLGLMLEAPFDRVTKLPQVIKHGGAQLSTRSEFLLNMKTNDGIIIFSTGERDWKNDPSDSNELSKGTSALVNEMVRNYRSIVRW